MLDTEYKEAEVMELFKKDARKERDREKISDMLKRGKTPEAIADFCGYPLEQIKSVQKELQGTKD